MIKVRATDAYEKNNIRDNELKRIPKKGEIFNVSEERIDSLLGNNKYKKVFVEVIEEEPVEKKQYKRTEYKAILDEDRKEHNVETADIQD